MIVKIQALKRSTDYKKKNTMAQREEFREVPTTELCDQTEEEKTKVIKKLTLIFPVTMQEQPADDRKSARLCRS